MEFYAVRKFSQWLRSVNEHIYGTRLDPVKTSSFHCKHVM
jgi:hypothetical protein